MRIFKLHKCDVKEYKLTKENFKRVTQEKTPYIQRFPDKLKHGYAFCPGCGNPIQIVGLYAPIKGNIAPYAKHYGNNVPGIGFHNEFLYKNCKHATHMIGVCPKEVRKHIFTDFEKMIYNNMREYFDKSVYLLKESIGINITSEMAKCMLKDYRDSMGYMYPLHTTDNMPWMLMFLSDYSLDPYGKSIDINSEVYKKLNEIDTVVFEEIPVKESDSKYKKDFAKKYKVLKTSRYTQISVLFLKHERKKIDEDNIREYITMTIAHRYNNTDDWIQDSSIYLELDDNHFQNIIHSEKAMSFRNNELLAIAESLLPVKE